MKKLMIGILLGMSLLLGACTQQQEEEKTESLSEAQIASLMQQLVADNELRYDEYLPDIWIASCEVFDIERDGDIGYLYAYILDEEYVKHKEFAYAQAGGYFPRRIEFRYDGEEVVYIGCENPEDGEGYEDSIKEMFSEEAFKEYKKYNAYDKNGNPLLMEKQKEKIEYIWKVDISEEDMLNINEDGSYEIVWTTGGGPEEPFEVHTKETGVLSAGENCNH